MTRIDQNLSPITGPVPLTPESRTGDFSGGGLLFSYVQNRPCSSYGLAKLGWIRCSRTQAVPLSEYATRGHRQGVFFLHSLFMFLLQQLPIAERADCVWDTSSGHGLTSVSGDLSFPLPCYGIHAPVTISYVRCARFCSVWAVGS